MESSRKIGLIMLTAIIVISLFTAVIPGIAAEPLKSVIVEPPEKIEELQQWICARGYNYTVAENWITALSPEERQRLCGYKPLTPPTEPLPENIGFRTMDEILGSEMMGQPPVGQPPAYDAMALGYVTPIKNQGICGACWIFAATTDFESDVAIGESSLLNFAEQEVGDCNIWYSAGGYSLCNGGNAHMTTNYFTKHGSANETCHPYAVAAQTCQNCSILKNVDNWRIITGLNGNDLGQVNTIKNAILTYGPVYSTIYASDSGFGNYKSGVYEYWGLEGVNHAIQIIGWDDSLTHTHGTGAWLIKNSWGTGWGAQGPYPGCAWVAYGAANIGDYTSAIAGYKNPGDTILYHDECGWMNWCFGQNNPTAYGAVRFTPSQNSTLTAVDFWAVDASMIYEIKIFDTLNDLGGGNYNFSNQLGTTQTGTTNEAGYYSIPLNTPVQLAGGNDFIVQVNLTTTTGWGYPLPIDYYDTSSHPWNPPLPQVFTFSGESYNSTDGVQFVKPTEDIGIRARQAFCLGDCYNTTAIGNNCTGNITATNVSCYECLGKIGVSWRPVTRCPGRDLYCPDWCFNACPACCDGIDNDADNKIDCPGDDGCACCCDYTETPEEPAPCVPELSTLVLFSIGLLALAGYVGLRKKRE